MIWTWEGTVEEDRLAGLRVNIGAGAYAEVLAEAFELFLRDSYLQWTPEVPWWDEIPF
jgi:hypothetical protein